MDPTLTASAGSRVVESVTAGPVRCINPASEVNARLDTQVEVRVYPCNNSQSGGKKKFTTFNVKPEVSSLLESQGFFVVLWTGYAHQVSSSGTIAIGSHYSRFKSQSQLQPERHWC